MLIEASVGRKLRLQGGCWVILWVDSVGPLGWAGDDGKESRLGDLGDFEGFFAD